MNTHIAIDADNLANQSLGVKPSDIKKPRFIGAFSRIGFNGD